jgi:hypothetical protein
MLPFLFPQRTPELSLFCEAPKALHIIENDVSKGIHFRGHIIHHKPLLFQTLQIKLHTELLHFNFGIT